MSGQSGRKTSTLSAMKLALIADEVREQVAMLSRAQPIAIIGMGCRFPGGADSPDAFWRLLRDGVDAVTEIPSERWDLDSTYDPDPAVPGKSSIRHAALLDRIDTFDAQFFGILPREAERTDPQQRIFMEVAMEALEHAGLPRERLAGSRTGVYVAAYHTDYQRMQYADLEWIDARTLTGTLHSVIANRLSYFLDLRGPSLTLDSACSSSLVAVHLACQSLRSGETDAALAGGVSIVVSSDLMVALSKVGFTSKTGRCRTFDANADGFVRGEGCGVVVLKRLSDAIAAGDRVLAVIRSSVVNQDGHSTVLTAPNGLAQQAMLREALANGHIEPARVGFIETHGTGTALGDPIEVEAISSAVGAPREDGSLCYLGSVKANLGHLEAAAGVAGLIKATLVLQHGLVPRQINFEQLNPHLRLDGTCIRVPATPQPFPAGTLPRVAGVSSFGVGGTNAHTLIEEPPKLPAEPIEELPDGPFILPISAQSPAALRELARRWIEFLANGPRSVAEICASAAARRSHYDHRLAVLGNDAEELQKGLRSFLEGQSSPNVFLDARGTAGVRRLGFVFCGQGPQWFAMGRELAAHETVFRDALAEVATRLEKVASWSLLREMQTDESESRLGETRFAQPAIFALQVALAALWKSWGIEPDGVVGHSIGELAALHVSGALSLDDAVRLVWLRAQAMQRATGLGAMAAVGLSESHAREFVRPYGAELSIGAVNSPRGVVLSGSASALQAALAELEQRGISHRRLPVSYAFHSAQMTSIAAELAVALGDVRSETPRVPFYSTVIGGIDDQLRFDASYFARNVSDPVRFSDALKSMLNDGFTTFVEVGPHPVLSASIAECAADRGSDVEIFASLRRSRPERETMLQACAGLYAGGSMPLWEALNPVSASVLDLPRYPWQHERFWLRERPATRTEQARLLPGEPSGHGLLGRRIPCASARLYTGSWPDFAPLWLADHRVAGRVLMPAAAMLEALHAAARATLAVDVIEVRDFVVHHPLELGEQQPVSWQVGAHESQDGRVRLTLHEELPAPGGESSWRLIASAEACLATDVPCSDEPPAAETAEGGKAAEIYDAFAQLGVEFGPEFRTIQSIYLPDDSSQASGWLERAESPGDAEGLHPTLLDGALQICVAAATGERTGLPRELLLPLGVDRYMVLRPAPARLRASVTARREPGAESLTANIRLHAPDGTLVGLIEGARFAPANSRTQSPLSHSDDWIYEVAWKALPREQRAVTAAASDQAWIVLVDGHGTGDALVETLSARGLRCLRVRAGEKLTRIEPDLWTVDPARPADFEAILGSRDWRGGAELAGVIHLWSLDAPPVQIGEPRGAEALAIEDLRATGSALHLLQAFTRSHQSRARLVFVTCGAQAAGGTIPRPAAAGVWGVLASAFAEFPDLRCRVLDLDPDAPPMDPDALAAELLAAPAARRMVLRGARRFVPRLRSLRLDGEKSPARRLQADASGMLDALAWKPAASRAPAAGEVRVRVSAAGLNFRDVLVALGMYPGAEAVPLGGECAGIVESIGTGVTGLRVGDAVFGFAQGSLAEDVAVPAAFLAHVPTNMSMEIAAGQPVAYLTAMLGLERIAGMRAGTRVLVHAAAGGVGMAAIRLAQRAGAEIFATAGSPVKRVLLQSMGVAHVFDSRSTTFRTEILEQTGGEGVDIVLNSLAGEFIPASFGVLAEGGCFLELGKRDIWTPEQAARARPDARYVPYDLGSEAYRDPGLIASLMAQLIAAFGDGTLQPLPVRVFDFDEAPEAFRYMAQARHTGKVVLRAARGPAAWVVPPAVHEDATYWITGGLGALGIRTALWLVERGARHLVLTGRRPPTAEAAAAIDACSAQGARVLVRTADAADPQAMAAVLNEVQATLPPLRGVVHAAGTLDDGVLLTQNWPRLLSVLRGKAHGAQVLHELTCRLPLDFFVMYSAAGLLLGPRGQAGYAAANAELDALAHARRAAGLPALSVAWGAWAGAGMAAAMSASGTDAWSARGLGWIEPADAFPRFEKVLQAGVAHAAIMSIDWRRFVESVRSEADREELSEVIPAVSEFARTGRETKADEQSLVVRWRAAPTSERRSLILAHVTRCALNVLGLDAATPIPERQALKEAGLDSLMAVELRNVLTRSVGRSLPATLLFDYPSLEALTNYLMRFLDLDEVDRPPASVTTPPAAGIADIVQLSDDEAEAQLLAELEAGREAGP